MSKHDFVADAEHWEQIAQRPDWFKYILTQDAAWDDFTDKPDSIFFQLDPQPDWTLVDLGCGGGRIAKWACPRVQQYIGLDVSPTMIARAKSYCAGLANARFLVASSLACLPAESADCLLSERVFIHLPRRQQATYVQEAFEVLKPGGLLFLSMPGAAYANGWERHELAGLFGPFRFQAAGHDGYLVRAIKAARHFGR